MLLRIPLLPPPAVALATLILILTPPHITTYAKEGEEEGRSKFIGHYYGQRFGRNQPQEQVAENDDDGASTAVRSGMTGIGLIFLILFLVALLAGVYFAAWCICGVQRSRKEGHYILDSEDHDVEQEIYGKKLYAGLDMVDEAKETYVKNQLDLDENPTATALPESTAAPSAAAATSPAVGEEEKPAPSAPEDNGASPSGGGANADAGEQV